MDSNIRVLILDDSRTDIKLISREIENYFTEVEIEAVTNRKDFIIKLSKFKPDVVISDYDLPNFDGLTALHITHEMYRDLPFIIVTGSASEEFGILCIKRGAYDYILKSQLQKIPVAIEEALKRYDLIKENKRVYDELRESEKRFRLLAENAQDIIFRFELYPQRGFSFVSPSVTKITGYTPEEFYNDPDLPYKIMHPDDKIIFVKVDMGEIRIDEPLTFRCFRKDGTLIWLELKNTPIFNGEKKLISIEGIARDVTERIKLENEIREKQEHFEKLADSTNTAIFVYQGEYFLYANKATEKISGYSRDELIKMKFYELVHPDFLELVKERGLRRQKGENVPTNYEFKIIAKDGEEKWIDFTGSLISWFGKPAGLGTAYDITPLKKAIENLELAQERWMAIFKNAPIGILIEDSKGTIVNVNKAYEKLTGYSINELIGQSVEIFIAPENRDRIVKHIQKILNGELLDHTVDSIKKDGSKIYVHLIETKFTLPDGSPGILSICEDITEKVKLENKLIESEKKFRTIFETANEGIAIADTQNVLIDVNKKFCEMTGYRPDEIIGKNFGELFLLEEDRKEQEIREQNRRKAIDQQYEVRLKRKDNSLIWARVSATWIFDNSKYLGSFAFFTDITEQKKLEEELKQSEEQFRLIWENSQDGMRLTDEEGKVICVNPAYCNIVGLPKEEIEGKYISDIYSYSNARKLEIVKKHRERFISENIKARFETFVTLQDGRKNLAGCIEFFYNLSWEKIIARNIPRYNGTKRTIR